MNRKIRIQRFAPKDRELWQKLYYRHKTQRQRRRLLALKAIWDGQTMAVNHHPKVSTCQHPIFSSFKGQSRLLSGPFALLEPVGIVSGFEDVAVVGDAVEQCRGRLGIAENL
jgi:hypothetical protein